MDENVEKIVNRKHEQSVSECKKLRTLIIRVVGSNITVIFKTEYDNVRTKYGEIINASEISNGDDAIAYFSNEYSPQQVPDTKHSKIHNIYRTDNDRKLSMSRNVSRNFK